MQEVKVRIPGRPSVRTPPSRSGAGRPIDAGIAVRKDGGWRGAAEERTDGRLSSFLLHFAHMRGGHGAEAAGREKASSAKSERASSELSTMLGAVLSALGCVNT